MARRRGKAGPYLEAYRRMGLLRVLGIALPGLVGAALAFALAASGVTRTRAPQTALRFMPGEAIALGARAEELELAHPRKPPREVQTLALASLRQQLLNPRALRVLGYYATAKGDEALARRYIRLAEAQTRRDGLTQFWLIEDSVQRGDLKKALTHYDIALRTQPATHVTLFPILLAALDDPAIRAALSPYIRTDATWAPIFITYAIANSNNLTALVDMILESGGLRNAEAAHRTDIDLLARLVRERKFADARRLYLHMPGATATRLTSTGFDAADRGGNFGAIGWQIRTDPDAGGGFAPGNDKRLTLSLFANPSTTQIVASKLLYLDPGSYTFATRLSRFESEGGFIRWELRCATAVGSEPFWKLDSSGTAVAARLAVSKGCAVQTLEIALSGGAGDSGTEAVIADIALRPLQLSKR